MSAGSKPIKAFLKKATNMQEVIVLIPLIILCVVATMINPNFVNPANLGAMARTLAPWGLLAIGETLIIIVGEIDISIGSMVSLGTVLFAYCIEALGFTVPAALLVLCVCTVTLSLVNGYCIVKLKIPAFLATIAMLYVCKGLAGAITNARNVSLAVPALENVVGGFLKWGQMEFFNLNWTFVLFVCLIFVFYFILKKTKYGRKLYATGDNINVARMAGINVDKIKISTFAISGLLVALTAMCVVGKETVGSMRYGEGWELTVVAATAIGGISLVGGSGTMIGTLIGTVMMGVISNILILLRVNQHYQSIVLGIIIVLSVVLDIQRRNKLLGNH